MMSYQVNDALIRPFSGPDMTDLEYQKKWMNSFFKVLQFNVYLIVKVVIFRGHFNAVQASREILKSALFYFFFQLFFSTPSRHLGDRHPCCSLPMARADFTSPTLLSAAPVSAGLVYNHCMGPIHTSECLIHSAGWGGLNGQHWAVQDQGTMWVPLWYTFPVALALFFLLVASLPFQRVLRIATRNPPSPFCLPAGVDAIYCSTKVIQRISFESQEDLKSFKSQIFKFQNNWQL